MEGGLKNLYPGKLSHTFYVDFVNILYNHVRINMKFEATSYRFLDMICEDYN